MGVANQKTRDLDYVRKDFLSEAEPRWWPGCGDYSILSSLTAVWSQLGVPKENFLTVSGIGCSSRLPYYVSTYGFHTIHGRAPTVALGAKLANPELSVWVITGDGDGLSIGTNHLIHLIRRNADINVLIFNNEIYGLTKGQVSPTSPHGLTTKSSPRGNIDRPINPLALAIANGATFVARAVDTNSQVLKEVLHAAYQHKGTSIVEILTNCIVFNDGPFKAFADKGIRSDHTVELRHQKPMLFSQDRKAIVIQGLKLEIGDVGKDGIDLPSFYQDDHDSALHYLLAFADYPRIPLPVGVIRSVQEPTLEMGLGEEKKTGVNTVRDDLWKLFCGKDSWTI